MRSARAQAAALLAAFAAVGALLVSLFAHFVDMGAAGPALDVATEAQASGQRPSLRRAQYLPPLPGDAPPELRETVQAGHRLMIAPGGTATVASSQVRCASCHFEGGRSEGGRNGGVSLVGAAARYPLAEPGGLVTLADQVRRCYAVNLGAAGPQPGSSELRSLVAYLQWLSRGVPVYGDVAWLGLPPLESSHQPDAASGQKVLGDVCAQCHGGDGQGTQVAPPLWGERSFTTGSTMTRVEVLAPFVAANMPRQNPTLSAEQALDVAAFVVAQPRPEPAGP